EIPFLLPEFHAGGAWLAVLDTANDVHPFEQHHFDAGARLPLQGRSMVALIATTPHPALRTQPRTAPAAQPPSLKGTRTTSAPSAAAGTEPLAVTNEPLQEPPKERVPNAAAPPTTEAPPSAPATAAPASPTEPLPEKLGEDAKGG